MNILLVDAFDVLNETQKSTARNRLLYSLCRFQHKVNGATLHVDQDENSLRFNCSANVSVEGVGIVSVRKSSDSFDAMLTKTVDAIEPAIATKLNWNKWISAEAISDSIRVVQDVLRQISRTVNGGISGSLQQQRRPYFLKSPTMAGRLNRVQSSKK